MAGGEGGLLKHGEAVGAVAGGAVHLPAAAETDEARGIGDLPAVDEHGRVLALGHRRPIGQGQVVRGVSVTETAEAHCVQFVAVGLGLDHHQTRGVVPLQFESRRAPDQVHVPCVVDLKAVLLKPRLGVSGVHVQPSLESVDDDVVAFVRDVQSHKTQVCEVPQQWRLGVGGTLLDRDADRFVRQLSDDVGGGCKQSHAVSIEGDDVQVGEQRAATGTVPLRAALVSIHQDSKPQQPTVRGLRGERAALGLVEQDELVADADVLGALVDNLSVRRRTGPGRLETHGRCSFCAPRRL